MIHLTRSNEDAVKLLDEKIEVGELLQSKCLKVQTKSQLDELEDEYDVWETSSAGLLRVIFDDETISKEFKETGVISYTFSLSLHEEIRSMHNYIKQSISKLKSIKQDITRGVYIAKPIERIEPNPVVTSAKIARSSAIIVAIITGLIAFITGYLALPSKGPTELQKQGLENISIEGKWKYVCTDYNGLYQHGGRFTVSKQHNGSMQLLGYRMWKDIYDSNSKHWNCNNFNGNSILPWKSTWIYVHEENDFNMEYEITVNGTLVKGYCTGNIVRDHDQVQRIEGYFYQLLPQVPLLAGRITFIKVTNDDYNIPVWTKNHTCQ